MRLFLDLKKPKPPQNELSKRYPNDWSTTGTAIWFCFIVFVHSYPAGGAEDSFARIHFARFEDECRN